MNMQPDNLPKYFDAARNIQPVTDADTVIVQAIKIKSPFSLSRRLLIFGLASGMLFCLLIFRSTENFISTDYPIISNDIKPYDGTELTLTNSTNSNISSFGHKAGKIVSPFNKEALQAKKPHYSEPSTLPDFKINKNLLNTGSFNYRIIYIDKEEAEILGFGYHKSGQIEFTCLSARTNDTTCISYLTNMSGSRRERSGYSYNQMGIAKPHIKALGIYTTIHDTGEFVHLYEKEILRDSYRDFFNEAYDYLLWVRYAPNPTKPDKYIELALEPDANIAQYFKGLNATYITERSSIWQERNEKIILTQMIEKYIVKSKTINPPFELTDDLNSRLMAKFVFVDEATLKAYGIKRIDEGYRYNANYKYDKKKRVIRVKQKGQLLDIYKNKTLFGHKSIPYRNTLYAISDTRLIDFSLIQDHPSQYEIHFKKDLLKHNLIDSLDHFNAIAIPFKYRYNNMEASDTNILWFRKTAN